MLLGLARLLSDRVGLCDAYMNIDSSRAAEHSNGSNFLQGSM
jgi:hypothetical protein